MMTILDALFSIVILITLFVVAVSIPAAKKEKVMRLKMRIAKANDEEMAIEALNIFRGGEPLLCLSCGARFKGPALEAGCQKCGDSVSFIVTEAYAEKLRVKVS